MPFKFSSYSLHNKNLAKCDVDMKMLSYQQSLAELPLRHSQVEHSWMSFWHSSIFSQTARRYLKRGNFCNVTTWCVTRHYWQSALWGIQHNCVYHETTLGAPQIIRKILSKIFMQFSLFVSQPTWLFFFRWKEILKSYLTGDIKYVNVYINLFNVLWCSPWAMGKFRPWFRVWGV